jgi:type IX secretion system PorP/SprF family membrane protein
VNTIICEGDSLFLEGAWQTTAGLYTDVFVASNGCDSTVYTTVGLNQPSLFEQTVTICQGTTFTAGTSTYNASGVYMDTLVAANGCDSIVTTNLFVESILTSSLQETLCFGDTYTFGTNVLTTSGTYIDTLTSVGGCDSVVTLYLNIEQEIQSSLSALSTSGTYQEMFTAANGCDSVVTLYLFVNPAIENNMGVTICQGQSYTFGAQTLTTSGEYSESYTTASGCDSLVRVFLTVTEPTDTNYVAQICEGDTLYLGSQAITTSGIYTEVFTTTAGCDSVVTVDLAVGDCNLEIANICTPNGDLVNDSWLISDLSQIAGCNVQIFNRWGQLLFDTNDYQNDWDGTKDGTVLPDGVYYYAISCDGEKMYQGVILVTVAFFSSAIAQQTRQTNLYGFNKFSMNPAYAGYSGCTEVNFSHLNQWVKVEGAPATSFLSANTRIGKSIGLGANLLIDRLGMLQQVQASGAASYGFTFAEEHHLRLGLAAGYFQMRVDPTNAIALQTGDVIVEGGVQSSNALNTEAGILYAFKGLELSFASKQVVETRSNVSYPNLDGYGLKRHLMGYAGYDVIINSSLILTPNVLYKGIDAVQQLDFNADLNYNDFLYGGLGYRTGSGIVGRLGVNIRNFFFVGYAYEIPMMNIASYGAGSHEFALGLKFCKKDKKKIEDLVSEEHFENITDTITIVETVRDTVIIEKVIRDTVYIESEITKEEVQDIMFKAAQSLEFENDKAIILEKSYGDLEALTNALLIRKDLSIEMEGHTDNNGSEEYNLQLSKNRVEAVKQFLVMNGVEEDRIKTSHFGESKPIADNSTPEGRAKNRRVIIRVSE